MNPRYNYTRFDADYYNLERFDGPKAGEEFIPIKLSDINNIQHNLSDLKGRWLVIESGSVTCPQYVANIEAMQRLSRKFPKVAFLVLYIREAHPGKRIPSHKSMEQKRSQASLTRRYDERRTVLVDSLDGYYHKLLGAFPNFVYVLNPDHKVVFRSDWNLPREVDRVLSYGDPKAFRHDDHFEPKMAPLPLVIKVILKAGVDAMIDLVKGLPRLISMHVESKNRKRFP